MKTRETKTYRINSIRIPEYDYSSENFYFVTICSFQQEQIFSKIAHDKIYLTEIGSIINEEWLKTQNIRENVIIDDYVIMPNHIHGIIVIDSQIIDEKTLHRSVSTKNMRANSLSSIINQIKSISTKRVRKSRNDPTIKIWQPRFYEHIIRNENELYEIRTYIKNNPLKWSEDEYNV